MKTFNYLISLLLFFLGPINSLKITAQTIIYKTQLPKQILETSGLEFFKDALLTHNDSGGNPSLYAFNEAGIILKEYSIMEAENVDWEDITQDENYIYIADSGNNKGKRQNL